MSEKEKSICRVCLSQVKKKSTSLFEEYKNSLIYIHINAIANVQIQENDGMPDKICSKCLLDLETAINFKLSCESSNLILRTSSLNPAPNSVEFDIKEVVVKKEEPEAEEVHYLDPDENYFDSELYDIDEEKPLKYLSENGVTKKSRAVDAHLQCDDCKEYFKSKCKLRVHWKKVHLLDALKCKNCKRVFKSFKAFNRHQIDKSKNCLYASNFRIEGEGKYRIFHCKECNYKSSRMKDMITHSVVHTGDRPFKCDICFKTCTQQSSLQAHKESAHKQNITELTCHYCGKIVKGRNKIYRHLKMHKPNQIQCPVCQKILKNKNCYRVHMQRHSGVKSYTCEMCAMAYYTSAELSNHKRKVHCEQKFWHKCDLCDYKAHRKESIKRHRSKHNSSNIPCTICGMFFDAEQKLILHQRRHFGEKRFGCPHCDKKFVHKDSVNKHLSKKHKCAKEANTRPFNLKKDNRIVISIQSEDNMVDVDLSPVKDN